MTRFEQEVSGVLGEYWKNHSRKEAADLARKVENDGVVDDDGAVKWKSNGRYLMDDLCEKLEYAGFLFSRENTAKKKDAQVESFLKEYRSNPHIPSDEEKMEMRVAFGSGAKVVDILTGETYNV